MIPGADVVCDWLFVKNSCFSHKTAANFRSFLNVAIFEKKINSDEDWIICISGTILEYNENVVFPFYEEKIYNY